MLFYKPVEHLHFDEHGLARNRNGEVTLFRRVIDPNVDNLAGFTPNAVHKSSARTLFHGIDGAYGGNTPESVSMLKNKLPYLMRFELPKDTEIDDLRHINNARWAGRHALALVNRTEASIPEKITIVRMTPPVSFMSNRYQHISETGIITPAWVITPPEAFAKARKKITEEQIKTD